LEELEELCKGKASPVPKHDKKCLLGYVHVNNPDFYASTLEGDDWTYFRFLALETHVPSGSDIGRTVISVNVVAKRKKLPLLVNKPGYSASSSFSN
jgi:hypothetical protein